MMINTNQYSNMGTMIIIVLLLALASILLYVVLGGRRPDRNMNEEDRPTRDQPDIIGRPKSEIIYSGKSYEDQNLIERKVPKTANLQSLTGDSPSVLPTRGSDEFAGGFPDWEEEEEEMQKISVFNAEGGLATGVTFDELANAAKLLQRQALEASERKYAAEVFSKIDGTELLDLLESGLGDASRKIAQLLDRSIAGQP